MITIGTDPELFLRDTRTGGVFPACGLLGGDKKKPRPFKDLGEGYAVQEDNVMAEFNIPPATDAHEFSLSIGRALVAVRDLVRTRHEHLDFDYAPARLFSHALLDNKQAQEFGCSPDFDGYTNGQPHQRVSPLELEGPDGAWRFAGGHVHLGYESSDIPEFVAAQFADVFLGLPSVALDKQGERRRLYGQAGRYRPTKYGIEYRTLSNFWVFDDALRRSIGYRAIGLGEYMTGDVDRVQRLYHEVPWHDVRTAINTENETLAADLLAYVSNDLGLQEAA